MWRTREMWSLVVKRDIRKLRIRRENNYGIEGTILYPDFAVRYWQSVCCGSYSHPLHKLVGKFMSFVQLYKWLQWVCLSASWWWRGFNRPSWYESVFSNTRLYKLFYQISGPSLSVIILFLIYFTGSIATEAFEDVGHSTDARELMTDYYIGDICKVSWILVLQLTKRIL